MLRYPLSAHGVDGEAREPMADTDAALAIEAASLAKREAAPAAAGTASVATSAGPTGRPTGRVRSL